MLDIDFMNRRCRLQRLSDARFSSAWIEDVRGREIDVLLVGDVPFTRDDVCMFEAFGRKSTAHFRALLVCKQERRATFAISGTVQHLPPEQEDTRLSLRGISGIAYWEGVKVAIEVLDGSEHGIGLVSEIKLTKGDMVTLELATPAGTLTAEGEVRYSRVSDDDPNKFRTGIRFESMSRVERARWERLLMNSQDPLRPESARIAS